jgi:hypothetical protein
MGIELSMPSMLAKNPFSAVGQGGVKRLLIDHYRQHQFACNWVSSCRLSLKTKEPLMRV